MNPTGRNHYAPVSALAFGGAPHSVLPALRGSCIQWRGERLRESSRPLSFHFFQWFVVSWRFSPWCIPPVVRQGELVFVTRKNAPIPFSTRLGTGPRHNCSSTTRSSLGWSRSPDQSDEGRLLGAVHQYPVDRESTRGDRGHPKDDVVLWIGHPGFRDIGGPALHGNPLGPIASGGNRNVK